MTRITNAKGEIKEIQNMKNMVQYRIINDNVDKAAKELIFLIEGLYHDELLETKRG